MDSIKVLIIAVSATLTPLLALTPESDGASKGAAQPLTVDCNNEEAPKTVTVSVPNSTVNFVCQPTYTFEPAVTSKAESQTVYSNNLCTATELLTSYCPTATLEELKTAGKELEKPGATLKVPQLPDEKRLFYVQCKPPQGSNTAKGKNADGEHAKTPAPCVVTVTVNQAANKDETGGAGQAGGVHVCRQPSITVKVPDKNSSVQFSCPQQFSLYPTNPARVFKEDCKTEEPLKDMTRTTPAAAPAPGPVGAGSSRAEAAAPPIYTLKAVEKPPKKKLCYLCATQAPTDKTPKPAGSYCVIYVESSARAPFGVGFTPLAFILSSVLAMLRLA